MINPEYIKSLEDPNSWDPFSHMKNAYNVIKVDPSNPSVTLKSGKTLSMDECKEALDAAMTIIEAVGTTGIHSRIQAAGRWMNKYYPQWA